ncbi:Phenylacetic acid catabolic protein [Burkholderia sp. SCN-KJ]|uniref:Phenylacetic acid catabolic protein n=1 Tax=Burkholderia sp. SCN-KJ TaxID=2969248 RepID=UPI00214FBE08|nr:Phenylacetic acid catabolic protein [Burkholderia sp. SCN-KJ]MCR4471361.1 phenylacetate-CoA oxygenase subunit PaaI [Burkholderia sp. SCN-KJ]
MDTAQKIEPLLGKHEIRTPEDFRNMPDEYRQLATHLMLVHTEGELTGADDYTQVFYNIAPNAFEKFVCCERASEEVQHYQLSAAVLSDIGVDTNGMLEQHFQARPYYANELVRGVKTWMERGIFSFLGEAVVLEHLLEFQDSSYQPFSEIFVKQIIKDEHVHVAHGYRIVRDACATAGGRREAQAAVDRLWPHVLALFGHDESRRSRLYVKWGLRKTTNGELRKSFVRKTVPRLQSLGLVVPEMQALPADIANSIN